MIRVSDVYASPWLHVADLQGRGVTVVIAGVRVQEFRQRDGKSERRIVLTFDGARKEMVLNATQARRIAATLGDDGEVWVGRQLRLQPGEVNGKGTVLVEVGR